MRISRTLFTTVLVLSFLTGCGSDKEMQSDTVSPEVQLRTACTLVEGFFNNVILTDNQGVSVEFNYSNLRKAAGIFRTLALSGADTSDMASLVNEVASHYYVEEDIEFSSPYAEKIALVVNYCE